ncbi:MAG: F0F1 ATP synthase subunit A [Candidatus Eisenbacteria bacterium]|uniref:ATP synthase subunit a n=1 Tax=Eiseniibacteriota bacterium TaxID=2212470 RepID=A0A7Y2EAN0_UNCEI|nr:F0F1 ATP synthase subunit A [Candidatus Eisenbacteria bacterium]
MAQNHDDHSHDDVTDEVVDHGDHGAADHGDGHGDGHGEHGDDHHEGGVLHFPTLVRLIADVIEPGDKELHSADEAKNPVAKFLWKFEDPIYSGILILILGLLFATASRKLELIPGPLQNFCEVLVEGLDNFIRGVIGPEGRKFVPFLGTLGIYVYVQNIFGLIPLMKSPTSIVETTAALAICVFVYVQFNAVRMQGIGGYFYHLAGEPKDAVGWGMAPLMFPLHVIGELAKPLSLALRLFGNVMGEDLLIVVFAGLGVSMLAFTNLPIGFPLHLPFMFLACLTTLIQALVFMLLSTIYIALVMPHHDHEEAH